MEETSKVLENGQILDVSSRKQNSLEENHDLGGGHLSMKENVLGEQSGLVGSKDNEPGLENVQCEPMDTGVVLSNSVESVDSDANENNNVSGSLNIEENEVGVILEEKHSNAQNLQTVVSSPTKPCSDEQVQGVTVGKENLGSDPVDAGLSGAEIVSGGSALEQNGLDAAVGRGSEHVSVEHMGGITVGSDAAICESFGEGKPENDAELVACEPVETRAAGFDEHNLQSVEHLSEHVKGEPTETKVDPVDGGLLDTPPIHAREKSDKEPTEAKVDPVDGGVLDTTPIRATENSDNADHKESAASSKSKKRKSKTPTSGPPRVLRPRVNGLCKTPETVGSSANITGEPGGSSANVIAEREKRKKRKRTNQEVDDEFSKIRKRVRYLLTRIGYEHNFIEAYCGDGWKGQSAEKIKPEKELQHAASRILQCKSKIRELFQQLDSSFAEGRFQESLFDSEGEISSDDIFCSKCGSKDLSPDNDIILCDGVCDRGFHQMCLKPPLLKEDIPPGDEGWLCPGCDCKVDCMDLLNDSQGTDLDIEDAWEKVFPEAAATADGGMNDDILGLPSDDSEDDEYNPETSEVKEGIQTEGSSSDDSEDSDFSSDSDDMGVRPSDDPYMGLPSDDSEDDDYDPDAPDPEKTKEESSCSESASEYFSASSGGEVSSGAEDDQVLPSVDGSKLAGTTSGGKIASNTKKPMNSELLSLLESGSQSDPLPVSGKRQHDRLDYKKLHDEAYGNDTSDSSDDEDWAEGNPSPRKNDDGAGEELSVSRKSDSKTTTRKRNNKDLQRKDSEENGTSSKTRKQRKKENDGASNTAAEMQIDSPEPDLVDKRPRSSSSNCRTLGEAVTERLYGSFKENEYPTRATKENLAKELGITLQQVNKWFSNARRSLRRQSSSGNKNTNKTSETKEKAPSKLVKPEKEILPNGDEIREPSKAGTSKDPMSTRDDSAVLDNQTLKEGSNNDHSYPVETEAKILPEKEVCATTIEPEAEILPDNGESIEASTRKRPRNENEVCATPVEPEADKRELIEPSTPKRARNENEDDQTPNSTPSNEIDRELVIAIPANTPIAAADQPKKRGRKANKVVFQSQVQTRSRSATK